MHKGSILVPSKAKALTEEIPPALFVLMDIAREEIEDLLNRRSCAYFDAGNGTRRTVLVQGGRPNSWEV